MGSCELANRLMETETTIIYCKRNGAKFGSHCRKHRFEHFKCRNYVKVLLGIQRCDRYLQQHLNSRLRYSASRQGRSTCPSSSYPSPPPSVPNCSLFSMIRAFVLSIKFSTSVSAFFRLSVSYPPALTSSCGSQSGSEPFHPPRIWT